MKQKLLLGLLLIGLSCSESDFKPKLTVLEQVANHLSQLGHSVKIIDDNGKSLFISSSLSRTDLAIEINRILILIAHPEQQFIVNNTESILNARAESVECSYSAWYDSGGATCTNWLCIADTSYSILSDYDCYGNECFKMWTSCHQL